MRGGGLLGESVWGKHKRMQRCWDDQHSINYNGNEGWTHERMI